MTQLPVPVLVGPTASGKSALAVELARHYLNSDQPAEIVNADSMLVYRGMDIGTAKPSRAERQGVPHHLIDIMDVTETASVAEFQSMAREVIDDCRDRGVIPIVVGGSALYTRAVIDQFDFPGTDPTVRARWEAELERVGPEALHRQLQEREPAAAEQILPGNGRRIVRALEVIELTGSFVAHLPKLKYHVPGVVQIGLDLDRNALDERIGQRVQAMWDAGFVNEVRRLVPQGIREGKTASLALGYRQVLAFLDGDISEAEAMAQTVQQTKRFARKQLGWYRRDNRIHWVPALAPSLLERVVGSVSPVLD